jgi:hypothetical protein
MSKLTIFINDQPVYEYDGTTTLSPEQLDFLDKIDRDMDRGLKINGELVSDPDPSQRGTFVAMNLIKALLQEDEAKKMVSCAYLNNRLPELTEVHARDQDGTVKIDLIDNTQP